MQEIKRILCVDDNEDVCDLLTIMLGLSDLDVICVADRGEALRLIKQEQFGLFIIDSRLPGISGLSMCEEIRKIDQLTPVIIYSGNAHMSDIKSGMLAGANAYLVKPETAEIVPTVKRLLDLPS